MNDRYRTLIRISAGYSRISEDAPPRLALLSPLIPSILPGFVSIAGAVGVGMLWFLVIRQQQVLQGIQYSLCSDIGSTSFRTMSGGTAINWMIGTVLVIVLVTNGFQRLRHSTAWRHYEQLRIGIKSRVAPRTTSPKGTAISCIVRSFQIFPLDMKHHRRSFTGTSMATS